MDENVELTSFQASLSALEREIAHLSDSDTDLDSYFRSFLERIVAVLGAGGAIWRVSSAEELIFVAHLNLNVAGLEQGGAQENLLRYALSRIIETNQSIVLPAHQASNIHDGGLGDVGANNSPHTLIFVPIMERQNLLRGIFLLISPPDVDPRAIRRFLGFVVSLCERAGGYLQRQFIKDLESHVSRSERFKQFLSSLHSSLDPRRSCYALANYGQELLGAYRCMAGTFSSRGKFRMEAVSGVESLAVKSSFIRSISVIARQVCRNGKALLVDNPSAAMKNIPGQEDDLITAARLYMLQAESLVMGIFPIAEDDHVVGALVVEKAVDEPIDAGQKKQIDLLLAESASAMSNCLTFRNLPFSALVRALGVLRDKIYRMPQLRRAVIGVFLALLVLAPLLITRQLKVIGTAQLIPTDARIAYVQQDGVIEDVFIPPDRLVQKGQVLARLDQRIIESEIDRVTNSIGENQLALLAADRDETRARYLEWNLKSLMAELKMYELQLQQYEIRAPATGLIITRDSQIEQLSGKPVTRGDGVLEIVPADSAWQLQVYIPENQAGHLLQAYDQAVRKGQQALQARVILNACLEETFSSRVLSVAPRANIQSTGDRDYRNVIEVRVEQPENLKEKIDPRQGLEGKVAIECGKHNLYYLISYEFINFIRLSLF